MKKKGAVYSVIALMLCVAVYLNWEYTRDQTDPYADVSGQDPTYLGQADLVNGIEQGGDQAAGELNDQTPQAVQGDYFSAARLSRQKARDEAVSILNVTLGNTNATADAVATANADIQALADNAVRESRIESLVVAKGYGDCVAFINASGINVIIPKTEAGLESADTARIKEIVIEETGVTADKIKIVETT